MLGLYVPTEWIFLYHLFLNMIDLCVTFELMNRMFGRIPGKHRKVYFTAGLVLILLLLCLSLFNSHLFFQSVLVEIPLSLLLLFFYKGSWQKKLFFSLALLSLDFYYIMSLNALTNLMHHKLHYYFNDLEFLLVYHVLLWLVLFLCARLCKSSEPESPLPFSLWLLLLGILGILLFLALCSLAFAATSSMEYNTNMLLHFTMMFLLLVLNYMVFHLYRKFSDYGSKSKETALLQQQLASQEKYYRDYLDTRKEFNRLRHDMKNHLVAAAGLYSQGRAQELLSYLDTARQELDSMENLVTTGNPYLDTVLTIKLQKIQKKHIFCKPEISVPEGLCLDFSDTVTILGNLLDNAIVSCLDYPPHTCQINLSLHYQKGCLLLHMDNPTIASILPSPGIGLKNVKNQVQKYSGILSLKIQNGRYHTDLVLYEVKSQN
ncbi:MAG: GHKL domain-containing protein [Blautia sp.]